MADLAGNTRRGVLRIGDVGLSGARRRPRHGGGVSDELPRDTERFIAHFETAHSRSPMDLERNGRWIRRPIHERIDHVRVVFQFQIVDRK